MPASGLTRINAFQLKNLHLQIACFSLEIYNLQISRFKLGQQTQQSLFLQEYISNREHHANTRRESKRRGNQAFVCVGMNVCVVCLILLCLCCRFVCDYFVGSIHLWVVISFVKSSNVLFLWWWRWRVVCWGHVEQDKTVKITNSDRNTSHDLFHAYTPRISCLF